MAERRETNAEFASILDKLKRGKPVVLAASTHDGEEVLIAEAARKAGASPDRAQACGTPPCRGAGTGGPGLAVRAAD